MVCGVWCLVCARYAFNQCIKPKLPARWLWRRKRIKTKCMQTFSLVWSMDQWYRRVCRMPHNLYIIQRFQRWNFAYVFFSLSSINSIVLNEQFAFMHLNSFAEWTQAKRKAFDVLPPTCKMATIIIINISIDWTNFYE